MFGDAVRQTAFAATRDQNVLVVISLRGGLDGLGMVVPHGDPGYYAARPGIAVPRESLVARDDLFGLHPGMQKLEWLYAAGELAAVHAVGVVQPNRSHFLAMEEIEDADPTSSVRRGWVNRMIGLNATSSTSEAIHLTSPIVPTMLVGSAPTLSADRLERIALSGATDSWTARRRRQLQTVWGKIPGSLGEAARSALETVERLAPVAAEKYVPHSGVDYPTDWPASDLSAALRAPPT